MSPSPEGREQGPGATARRAAGTTVAAALRETAGALTLALGEDAPREAQRLVAAALGLGLASLLAEPGRPVDAPAAARLRDWARRRAAGEPYAYLVGCRGFWTLELEVGPAVLVPRPETELLVERVLACGDVLAAVRAAPLEFADLGTGSGAIALAVARERPAWNVVGVDVSPGALAIARRNAARHGLERVQFVEGDWFTPLAGRRFDLVASNPPYVAADDPVLQGDSLRHEPRSALTPGPDALAALRAITRAAPAALRAGGSLLLEHGSAQGEAVRACLVARGFRHVVSSRDLAGHERVTEGRLP
jgi:release factor glutamine methyltransferase